MNKKYLNIAALALLTVFIGCKDYLDIVPNNSMEEADLFASEYNIEQVLTKAYSLATPNFQDPGQTVELLYTDEIALPPTWEEGNSTNKQIATAMNWSGMSENSNSNYNYWLGSGLNSWNNSGEDDRAVSLWKAIRQCDFFLQYIDEVPEVIMDKTVSQKRKGEALYVKAFAYFMLLRQYGPIPLVKTYATPNSTIDELKLERRPYDECVEFIDEILSEASNLLPAQIDIDTEFGRASKVACYALKSRLRLYAASPLFNGNSMYAGISNKSGEALFNSTYDAGKWEQALNATDSAIFWAETSGNVLHTNGNPGELDYSLYPNPAFEKAKDSYRGVSMLPYNQNKEILWGFNPSAHPWETSPVQTRCLPRKKTNSNRNGYASMGATLRMAEIFYTENGLPIDEDISYPYEERYNTVTISEEYLSKAQVGEVTAKLNLDREPRFYGALAFDRGYYKCQGQSGNTVSFNGEITIGYGLPIKMRYSEAHGQKSINDQYYSITGYIPKRKVHFDSADSDIGNIQNTVTPVFRLAELYLNKAEVLNELNGPSQEVFDAMNKVRERANVPNVEIAWKSANCKNPAKIDSKEGLREIIHQERNIEFAFEGHRTWDLRRWLKGDILNTFVRGWNVAEKNAENFYTIQKVEPYKRSFTPTYYLWPVPFSEILKNDNMVQNYGY